MFAPDHFDAGAANSSFSPGSLKLSMMTPQEIKLVTSLPVVTCSAVALLLPVKACARPPDALESATSANPPRPSRGELHDRALDPCSARGAGQARCSLVVMKTTTLSVGWAVHRISALDCMLILIVPLHDGGDDDRPGPPYASQLPEAFKPEMLATLEKSCRKFFMCVPFFSCRPLAHSAPQAS